MTQLPFARKVDEALRQIDRIPLYGYAPLLDLSHLSTVLSEKFGVPLSLELVEASWRTSQDLYEGFATDALHTHFAASPLKGSSVWVMSHEDVTQLTSLYLKKNRSEVRSELLQEGFYLYLLLQVLDILQDQQPLNEFTLRIHEEAPQIQIGYCIEIKLSIDSHSCFGRLILSDTFLNSWQNHFSSLRQLFPLSPLAKTLEVPVGITVGSILLGQEEWRETNPGDVILLDRGSYNPKHKEGVASLVLGATPLFHVSIKENKIKLLERALFYEEDMDKRETTEQTTPSEAQTVAVKELPLFVTIELTRLRMTVDQLMNLSPGNFLELPVDPAQGVLLTVNGQKIARGELVYLGEALGVRILEDV